MEKSTFDIHPAPVGIRFLAFLTDYVLVFLLVWLTDQTVPSLSQLMYLAGLVYLLLRDVLPLGLGQGFGKRVFGLQVICTRNGLPPEGQLWIGLIRTLPMIVPVLNLFDLGHLLMEPDVRWGDKLAGTRVVYRTMPDTVGRSKNWFR